MADESDPTVPEQSDKPWLFKPGQSGNPAGRSKGSRNKFGEKFIEALHDDFLAHGVAAIQLARESDPIGYMRVCASILPKELKIERVDELSDDELDARIRTLAAVIGIEIRAGEPSGGTSPATQH